MYIWICNFITAKQWWDKSSGNAVKWSKMHHLKRHSSWKSKAAFKFEKSFYQRNSKHPIDVRLHFSLGPN